MHKKWLFLFGLLLNLSASAQIGGRRSFEFLSLPNNARLAGIGGINVSATGPDVALLYANPALLQVSHKGQVNFSFTDFISDISQNTLTYAFAPNGKSIFAAGITYINYGKFTQRDAAGQEEGKFSVNDYAISLTHSSTIDNFTLGASLKMAVSGIVEYKAVGILADLGGIFKHPEKDFTVGLGIKNIGYQVKSYYGSNAAPMPLDVQMGLTYKPEHMPLRFSITAHRLQQFNIFYADTTNIAVLAGVGTPKASVGGTILRHFVVGGEFILSKNFNLRAGYNHLRNREMRLEGAPGAAGFSLGTLLQIRSFSLEHAHSFYHKAGGANYISVSTNVGRLFKAKEKIE